MAGGAFKMDNCWVNFINIITNEENLALVSLRCVHDRVFTNDNCFQVASRKVVMSHAVISLSFYSQQRISNSYRMAYGGKEQMLAETEADL